MDDILLRHIATLIGELKLHTSQATVEIEARFGHVIHTRANNTNRSNNRRFANSGASAANGNPRHNTATSLSSNAGGNAQSSKGKRFNSGVSKNTFKRVLQALKHRYGDRIIMEDIEDTRYNNNLRLLQITDRNTQKVQTVLDSKVRLANYDRLNDYGIRFSASQEINHDLAELQLVDDKGQLPEIAHRRQKKRTSFIRNGWRYDLTEVFSLQQDTWIPSYEIEMEWTGHENINQVFQNLPLYLHELFSLIHETEIMYSFSQRDNLLQQVNSILQGRNASAASLDFHVLSKPRDLKYTDMVYGGLVGNSNTVYTVAHKADGFRKLIYFNTDGIWLIFPPNNVNYLFSVNRVPELVGTILEAEYIPLNQADNNWRKANAPTQKYWLLIYDCLALPDNPGIRDLPYIINTDIGGDYGRMNEAQRVVNLVNSRLVSDKLLLETKSNTTVLSNNLLRVASIEENHQLLTGGHDFYQVMRGMFVESANKQYYTDGFIFTPVNSGYIPDGNYEPAHKRVLTRYADVIKWKPPNELSIDFQIRKNNPTASHAYLLYSTKPGEVAFTGLTGLPFYLTADITQDIISGNIYRFKWAGKGLFQLSGLLRSNANYRPRTTNMKQVGKIFNYYLRNPRSNEIKVFNGRIVENSNGNIQIAHKYYDIKFYDSDRVMIFPGQYQIYDWNELLVKAENNDIIEFRWYDGIAPELAAQFNSHHVGFYAYRRRPDKVKPNRLDTAEHIFKLMINPIAAETLMGTDIVLFRKYINRVKKDYIHTAYEANKYDTLLDIGSGVGGDISKMLQYRRVLLVEPMLEHIPELIRRVILYSKSSIPAAGNSVAIYWSEGNSIASIQNINTALQMPLQTQHYERIVDNNDRAAVQNCQFVIYQGGGQDHQAISQIVQYMNDGPMSVVSSMLSLSFFWQNTATLQALIQTISQNLHSHGKFIFTTIDGDAVGQFFEPTFKSNNQTAVPLDNITLRYLPKEKGELTRRIYIDIPGTIVKEQTEWLVRLDDLIAMLWPRGYLIDKTEPMNQEKFLSINGRFLANLYLAGSFQGKFNLATTNNIARWRYQELTMDEIPDRPEQPTLPILSDDRAIIQPTLPDLSRRPPLPSSPYFTPQTFPMPPNIPQNTSYNRRWPGLNTNFTHSPFSNLSTVAPDQRQELTEEQYNILHNYVSGLQNSEVRTLNMIGTVCPNNLCQDPYHLIPVRWFDNVVTIGTIGDGSCLIHSILLAMWPIYQQEQNKQIRQKIVRSLRRDLAEALSEVNIQDPEKRIYYQTVNNGLLPVLAQAEDVRINYSLQGIQRLINSCNFLGDELYNIVADFLGIDLYITIARTDDLILIHEGGKHQDPIRNEAGVYIERPTLRARPSVVVMGQGAHFECVGVRTSAGIQTVFPPDSAFINALSQSKNKSTASTIESLANSLGYTTGINFKQ